MNTRTSRFRNPLFRLRFITSDETGGGPDGESEDKDLGFPADTKPEDMTVEQQLAFHQYEAGKWKGLSRKHEKNRKPESFDADMAELTTLREKRDAGLSDTDKAAAAAARAAAEAAATKATEALLVPAVREAFRARAPHLSGEELDEFLEDIDVTPARFLSDGQLDLDRVDRLAKRITKPADDEGGDKQPRFNLGDVMQRDSRKDKKSSGNPRQEAYERTRARFAKKSTDSK